MRRTPESDPFTTYVRYALLVLVFCVLNVIELAHAKFALLTNCELHAYWLGRGGRFPFMALSWSERSFGGDALAMRLPLLAVFAVLLGLVLLALDRMVLRRISAITLTALIVAALFAIGVQQAFSLKKLRAEKRAFFVFRDRVERATAPGEEIVVEENLLLSLYEYGSEGLRQELRRETILSNTGAPPVPVTNTASQGLEIIFIGSENEAFARELITAGYIFRKNDMQQPDMDKLVARYYHAADVGIYFVSPPVKRTASAVSSKS